MSDWLEDVEPLTADPDYEWDFVDGYKHPQQLYSRFEEIARQYPNIAQIVRLPNRTNGYQRKAQATLGSVPAQAVVVSSAAWGHEGGNDITVELVQRSGSNRPLEVEVDGKAVRVLLAKGATGELDQHGRRRRGGAPHASPRASSTARTRTGPTTAPGSSSRRSPRCR